MESYPAPSLLIEVSSRDAVEERNDGGIEIDDVKRTPECIRDILESDSFEDFYECPTQLDKVEVNDSPEDTWKDYSPNEGSDSSNAGGESSGPDNNTEDDCQVIMTNTANARKRCIQKFNILLTTGTITCAYAPPHCKCWFHCV
ncbi:hypothetical protein [Thiomicrorhabdus sp.]|uniref:hypothetical protein n=1 Tax=Thiomicrorhabdus sp. TaxID=2039724 RepID=UPI0029C6E55C|nr:hypothetical protein [Thiomicrorhabdus sp.]